jgi:hypothetical protein
MAWQSSNALWMNSRPIDGKRTSIFEQSFESIRPTAINTDGAGGLG